MNEATDAAAVLAAVGAVTYAWTIADDRIRWGDNVADVLGVPAEAIPTGKAYAALLDPAETRNRHDVVLNATTPDAGDGVAYEIQYMVVVERPAEGRKRLIIEDTGRWYADATGKPARAHGMIRVINDRVEREERRAFLSRFDDLTGFFNRAQLITALGDALNSVRRSRNSIAFLIVAVDNFRAINEAYDFDTADQVFAAVGRRIKGQLRDGDAIGRYSGNKLGIVLMNCGEAEMLAAAERFHAAVRKDIITTETSSLAVTVSIGGVGLPKYARTVNEAMARAQEALHEARRRGYGRFVAYAPSPARQAKQRENATLSSELVAALSDQRLTLSFQPVADIATRKPVFHEGLLRLERTDGTFATADDFIGLSERLGLIRMIDDYVLARTLEALEAVPRARISVNVSAETVGDAGWLSRVASAIAARPDIAGRLIVEITETAVIRNLEEASQFVATLRDLGCPVAIDDFGAGFSSFRNLRSLDVDMVKIAGVFLSDLARSTDDQAFVKALVALARNFGIGVVAEWVEDEESAQLLESFGVDMIQGHLTGSAAPDQVAALGNQSDRPIRKPG